MMYMYIIQSWNVLSVASSASDYVQGQLIYRGSIQVQFMYVDMHHLNLCNWASYHVLDRRTIALFCVVAWASIDMVRQLIKVTFSSSHGVFQYVFGMSFIFWLFLTVFSIHKILFNWSMQYLFFQVSNNLNEKFYNELMHSGTHVQ